MHRSDINVTELAPRVLSGVSLGTTCACWVCQNNLSTRAVFCQDCGTVQPSRAVDHFTRLGFERRFDLAHSELGGRYDALRRVFLAERAAAKGPRQQQIVSEHLSALEAAYGVLADPARRAEYILRLADYTDSEAANAAVEPYMAEFVDELNSAADAVAIDRVAHKAWSWRYVSWPEPFGHKITNRLQ